jgi:hypothetical protein
MLCRYCKSPFVFKQGYCRKCYVEIAMGYNPTTLFYQPSALLKDICYGVSIMYTKSITGRQIHMQDFITNARTLIYHQTPKSQLIRDYKAILSYKKLSQQVFEGKRRNYGDCWMHALEVYFQLRKRGYQQTNIEIVKLKKCLHIVVRVKESAKFWYLDPWSGDNVLDALFYEKKWTSDTEVDNSAMQEAEVYYKFNGSLNISSRMLIDIDKVEDNFKSLEKILTNDDNGMKVRI